MIITLRDYCDYAQMMKNALININIHKDLDIFIFCFNKYSLINALI